MATTEHTAAADSHEGGHHDHHHHPNLAHHYESLDAQFDAGKLGMWLFLVTEILFFSGLFVFYAIFRAYHPEIFEWGHKKLVMQWGLINTIVLIFSSLTMAWAVRCAQLNQKRGLIVLVAITIGCAFIFCGVKYIEYSEKIAHGTLWAGAFDPHIEGHGHDEHGHDDHGDGSHAAGAGHEGEADHDATSSHDADGDHDAEADHDTTDGLESADADKAEEIRETLPENDHEEAKLAAGDSSELVTEYSGNFPASVLLPKKEVVVDPHDDNTPPPPNAGVFFSIYFCMTGLHAFHVIVGIGVLFWVLIRSIRGDFSSEYYEPVDLVGLYWHLVDLIWIFLFPMLYLID